MLQKVLGFCEDHKKVLMVCFGVFVVTTLGFIFVVSGSGGGDTSFWTESITELTKGEFVLILLVIGLITK